MSHLHLVILDNRTSLNAREVVRSFLDVLLGVYTQHATKPSSHFKRQALVAYGRELVTAVEFFGSDMDDQSLERVLNTGVRSLRAAQESESEMEPSILNACLEKLWEGIINYP